MIEVGEYVRTDKGYIVKIDKEKKNLQMLKFLDVEYGNILKHSKNIKDLIEDGDYVNGQVVEYIYGYDEDGNDKDGWGICEVDGDYAYYIYLENVEIYSIITKEQIKQIEFRIGD